MTEAIILIIGMVFGLICGFLLGAVLTYEEMNKK